MSSTESATNGRTFVKLPGNFSCWIYQVGKKFIYLRCKLLHLLLLFCDVIVNVRIISPLGIDSLVQIHEHSVLLGDLTIKDAFHVAVSAQGFLDVSPPSTLGPQLHRLEPVDVLPVEKHEPHGGDPLVNLDNRQFDISCVFNFSISV